MVLVDRSVWIATFRKRDPLDLEAFVDFRSSVDCLIAASALRHELTVLHRDRDYPQLAKIAPLQERGV